MFQGDDQDNETLSVINGMAIQDPTTTSVTYKNRTAAGVETIIPARFFENVEASTTVTGTVQVGFASRRLIATDHDVRPVTSKEVAVAPREMRAEGSLKISNGIKGIASHRTPALDNDSKYSNDYDLSISQGKYPGYHGDDASFADQPASRDATASVSKRTPSFKIKVGLTTGIPPAKPENFQPIEANSARIKLAEISHFLGAIVSVAWAHFW